MLASDYEVMQVLATEVFIQEHGARLQRAEDVVVADSATLASLGNFRTNDGALAVARTKPNNPWSLAGDYGLMLDQINDPGNLGTIIRIADWFGIPGLVVSENVPELYNPKVIAASKGSFCRVPVYYTDLPEFIRQTGQPVYGADLTGQDIHSFHFPKTGWIVIGNEAHGLSDQVKDLLTASITIPSYGAAESLNAGIATAIICDNLRRIRL